MTSGFEMRFSTPLHWSYKGGFALGTRQPVINQSSSSLSDPSTGFFEVVKAIFGSSVALRGCRVDPVKLDAADLFWHGGIRAGRVGVKRWPVRSSWLLYEHPVFVENCWLWVLAALEHSRPSDVIDGQQAKTFS